MVLKTLKDFKEVEPFILRSGKIIEKVVSEGYASKEELKKEAIKWINKLQKSVDKHLIFCSKCEKYTEISAKCSCDLDFAFYNCPETSDSEGTINFIKIFFNITEEDLITRGELENN